MGLGAAVGRSAHAADVRFGGILPGGALYDRSVVSVQEGRYLNMRCQHTDHSCGVADVALVKQRLSMIDIQHHVESLGIRGRGYRIDEERLRTLRVPALVLMDMRGFRHFVVLKQVRGDQLAGPMLRNRQMPRLSTFPTCSESPATGGRSRLPPRVVPREGEGRCSAARPVPAGASCTGGTR